jgi:tRNA(Ile)-lysidine synthase
MEKNSLFPSSGRAVIAVSGGRDSMALLVFLKVLLVRQRIKSLHVLHVNHGTRKENKEEEDLVKDFSSSLGLECQVFDSQKNLKNISNFEKQARDERYRLFSSSLGPHDFLFMAHHIDDSFEWSLMQSMRSGEAKTCLGIPLVAGKTMRPFLSVTRNQISSFVKALAIPFLEDPSNTNSQYERNYIRHHVIPLLKKKWPQYLKHYVFRSNQLAKAMGVQREKKEGHLQVLKDSKGGVFLMNIPFGKDFSPFEGEIKEEIKKLSDKKRGVLSLQVQKTCEACKKGKFGPLLYSGRVWGYLFPGLIYLATEKVKERWSESDVQMAENLRNFLESPEKSGRKGFILPKNPNSPLVFFQKIGLREVKSLKGPHPLLPEVTKLAENNGIDFQSMSIAKNFSSELLVWGIDLVKNNGHGVRLF